MLLEMRSNIELVALIKPECDKLHAEFLKYIHPNVLDFTQITQYLHKMIDFVRDLSAVLKISNIMYVAQTLRKISKLFHSTDSKYKTRIIYASFYSELDIESYTKPRQEIVGCQSIVSKNLRRFLVNLT